MSSCYYLVPKHGMASGYVVPPSMVMAVQKELELAGTTHAL